MSDDNDDGPPDIGELEPGDSVRIEYRSQRSGNMVERRGEVAQVASTDEGDPLVYVHDECNGLFDHTFVALHPGTTTQGNDCIAAVSVSTEPTFPLVGPPDPPRIGGRYAVEHAVGRSQTLGIVGKVIKETSGSLTPNVVL